MKTILQIDNNYQNHHKSYFLNKLIAKLLENGNDYVLIKDDEPMVSLSHLKITKLLNALKSFPDDEIILYLDSFDTMVFAKDKEIEKRFLDSGLDVLFAAEKVCWPDENLKSHFEKDSYLNSGSILFKNSKYQKILQLIANILNPYAKECDQYLHTLRYAVANLDVKSALDKDRKIFQCLNGEDVSSFEEVNGRFLNKKSNSYPIIFHGNGTDGFHNLNRMFNYDGKAIKYHRISEDKSTLHFLFNETREIRAYIYRTDNSISYETAFKAEAGIEYYISAGQCGSYIFRIYESNAEKRMLLQEKNNYNVLDFLNQFKINL